jgi:tetratricopeptide (TPR) repeat protein
LIKDTNSAEIALRIRAAALSMVVLGLCIGGGVVIHAYTGASMWLAVIAGCTAATIVYASALYFSERGGRIGASLFSPDSHSTPPVRQYSLADSLVARGKFDEACEAYELLAQDYPDDPEPRIRLARLLRDQLQQPEAAADWFRKVIAVKNLDAATDIAVHKEISELYMHRLHAPRRALPYLAKLSSNHPDHPFGKWARDELVEIKQAMQDEME